ncbi:MAG: hypothetical protein Q8S44_00455 [Flavobacteriaceae bacterium]|nr:hypothetical protein [Flavobacteriaceae bacterium]
MPVSISKSSNASPVKVTAKVPRLLQQIKASYQKVDEQMVTINEFCNFTGINHDFVVSFIH